MSLVERAMAKLQSSADADDDAPLIAAAVAPVAAAPAEIRKPRLPAISLSPAALQAAGLSPAAVDERRLADQYRQIKRPILNRVRALIAARATGAQLIMMASALPGDGKTFSSFNLAVSIARERDVSVLLVDADVAKPHISHILGIDQEPGLLDALADKSIDVESFVQATDMPGLSILPAGRRHEAATELLASTRMAEVAALLSAVNRNRVVLFDSPPLLLSSESRAVVQLVGQVVMVVRAGSTPQGAVLEAISLVGADKLTGLVLNQSEMVSSGKHYGYGSYGDDNATSSS